MTSRSASLGHTGGVLTATRATQLLYVAAIFSAIARIAAGFGMARNPMLHLAAAAWVFAFAGFVAIFGPCLRRAGEAARCEVASHPNLVVGTSSHSVAARNSLCCCG